MTEETPSIPESSRLQRTTAPAHKPASPAPLTTELLEDRVVPSGGMAGVATELSQTASKLCIHAALGDVTGDGVADLVLATGTVRGTQIHVVNGADGRLVEAFRIPFKVPKGGPWVALLDATGDGLADIILWNHKSKHSRIRALPSHVLAESPSPSIPPPLPPGPGGPPSLSNAQLWPSATFTNSGPVNEGGSATASFTNVSDPAGAGVSYSYDFNNDGVFEIKDTPNASASVPSSLLADGPKTLAIRGRVTDADGRFSEYVTQLQVNNVAPTPNAGGPYAQNPGVAVNFRGSATDPSAADAAGLGYAWDFGDGTTGSGASPSHAYAQTGSYVARLTVTDKDGASASASTPVSITADLPGPSATLTNSGPVSEGSSATVRFTNVSDPLGAGLSFSYDFNNDGVFEIKDTPNAAIAVPTSLLGDGPKTLTIRGRVTDADGRFSDYVTQLQDNNVAPTPNTGGPYAQRPGVSINFQGSASDPSAADTAAGFMYAWDFGDGASSNGANPSHTYAQAGTYTARLTVTDKDGGSATAATTVSVAVPSASGVLVTPDWITTPFDKIPNFGGHPTLIATQSGDWSDSATWGGRLPGVGEVVSIGAGVTVTYDQVSDVHYDTVAIQSGGTLQFRTDVSTRLRVTNLLVMEGGTLTVGTTTNPVAASVKAEIIINDVPIDTTKDPEQYGHGLIALGKVSMHGATMSDAFMQLAAEAHAGDTTLTLAQSVTGWRAGDRIILPDTRQLYSATRPDTGTYSPQDELATLAAVSADGRTLTLAQPLQFDHLGARDGNGNLSFLPHIGDLTRNLVVKSENVNGTRGQTLFTMRADVDIEYAQFSGLGRSRIDPWDNTAFDASGNPTHIGTNEQGRYPVQFRHLMGPASTPADGYQYTFLGNSVFCPLNPMPFRWGIDINDSHYGLVQGNVLYNWAGAGIVGESGNESYNVIAENYVVRITGAGTNRADDRGGGDIGHEGSGLWFRGPNNYIRDNIVAHAHFGYTLYFTGMHQARVPLAPGYSTAVGGQYNVVDMTDTPLLQFQDNEAYGATSTGLTIWSLGTDINTPWADARDSVIKDFHVWNVYEKGYYGYETNRLTFDGLVFRGDFSLLASWGEGPIAIYSSDYFQKDFTITNSDIQGAKTGWMPSVRSEGTQTIRDSYLRNYWNVVLEHMWRASSTAQGVEPRLTIISNVKFGRALATDRWDLDPQQNICMIDKPTSDAQNFVQTDQVFVYAYNGVSTDNFRVYYAGQAANAVVPQSTYNADGTTRITASPVAGLTNTQDWAQNHIAVGGEVAPLDATTRTGIQGLVAPI
jgi:PKD repeat protein